jgi:hypothetical protein
VVAFFKALLQYAPYVFIDRTPTVVVFEMKVINMVNEKEWDEVVVAYFNSLFQSSPQ